MAYSGAGRASAWKKQRRPPEDLAGFRREMGDWESLDSERAGRAFRRPGWVWEGDGRA